MRNRIVPLSLAAALAMASVPVLANKGGQSASHAPHAPTVKNQSVKTTGPKTTHGSTPKSSTPKNAHATTPPTTSAKGGSKKNTTSNTSTPSTPSTFTPLNPIAQKLSTKSTLLSRATAKFGEQNLNLATSGFKNFGQFVAAMNVSNNLNIDFSKLKLAMTGTDLTGVTTGTGSTASLGQAIHQLKPGVDANTEAARAEHQAAIEID
jgi:hypothetical protein